VKIIRHHWAVLVLILAGGLAGLLVADHHFREKTGTAAAHQLEQNLVHLAMSISNDLQIRVLAVEELSAVMLEQARLPLPDESKFNSLAKAMLRYNPEIRAFGYIDPNRIIRYIYPMQGNEAAISLDLMTRPAAPFVERAIRERRTTVNHPTETVQKSFSVIARTPLYRGDTLLGLVQGIFDIDSIVATTRLNIDAGVAYQLHDATGRLLHNHGTIVGAARAAVIPVGDNSWTLTVGWKTPMGEPEPLILGMVWLGGGLLLLSLLFIASRTMTHTLKLERAVAQRTQQLAAANGALQNSKSRLEQLLTTTPGVIYCCEPANDYRATYISDNVRQQLGYDPEEFTQKPDFWEEHIHPEDREGVFSDLSRLFEADSLASEYRFLAQDGTYRWMRDEISVIRNNDGEPRELVGYWVDITDRKQAEEKLREAHDELEQRIKQRTAELREEQEFADSLFNIADSIVVVLDTEGRIVNYNPYMARLSGYALSEVGGKEWFATFLPEADRGQIRTLFSEAITGHPTCGNINPIVTRDGREIQIEWHDTTIRDSAGNITGLLVIGHDVTERLAYEQERRIKDAAIASSADAIAIADLDGHLTYVNPAFMKMWGYDSMTEVLGRAAVSFWEDIDAVRAVFRSLNEEDDHWNGQLTAVHGDGSPFPVRIAASLVKDEAGRPLSLMAVFQDLSERLEFEKSLREAKLLAEQANQAKSQFLSRMSHELRTPLNAILGFGQILEAGRGELGAEEQQQHVAQILKSGRHLLEVVNDVLDLSKIETGKLELSTGSIDAAESIRESLEMMRPLAQERNISLDYTGNVNDEHLWILADSLRFRQILLNLLSNAIKYNRSGGSVTVNCEKTADGRLRISVKDTGSGIAGADLAAVFEPFSQLYLKTYATEGTGIGLALSKQLVELMGGAIGAESEYGKGSTFWVELRLTQAAASVASRNKPADAVPQTTVLYIEDSPSNVQLVKTIIEAMPGFHLLVAHTPELGLELAMAHKPELIILDICLPGMDGYEVLGKLRQYEALANTPVMAVSAGAMPQEVEKGLHAGFRRYLTKPFEVKDFRQAVRDLIRESIPQSTRTVAPGIDTLPASLTKGKKDTR